MHCYIAHEPEFVVVSQLHTMSIRMYCLTNLWALYYNFFLLKIQLWK